MSDPKVPFYLLGSAKNSALPWATLFPVTQTYGTPDNGDYERGIDIATPFPWDKKADTGYPIVAAFDGTVSAWQYLKCPGGVLSTECWFPLKVAPRGTPKPQMNAVYYQHIDLFNPDILIAGFPVKAGETIIGWSGGQLHGGHHPNQKACSTGPHVEFGINPPFGYPWNPKLHSPSVDPLEYLTDAALERGITPFDPTVAPGFLPLAQQLQDALWIHGIDTSGSGLDRLGNMMGSSMRNIEPIALRMLISAFGALLIIGVMWNVLRPSAEHLLSVAETGAEDAAKLAPLVAA